VRGVSNQSCKRPAGAGGCEAASRGTVLVVDDEPAVAELLCNMMERKGFQVEIVLEPRQAASRARATRPVLITLDVSMPGIDGLELLGVLRHDPETASTPVVVVSGTDAARAARLGGAAAFVPKPVDPALLYARIEQALEEARGPRHRPKLLLGGRAGFRRRARRIFGGAGFTLVEAADGQAVLEAAEEGPVAAVIDLDLPPAGALDVVESLRALPVVGDLPVVLVGGRLDPEQRAFSLEAGCDDVVAAPVYPAELLARIQRLVRRRIDSVDANPSTGLPGGVAIEREIARRVGADRPFVFCYADVDHFKAFNDVYGYAKADGVIRHLASMLVAAGRRHSAFVGHVGGDDFVILADEPEFEALAHAVTSDFDRLMGLHYDPEDLEVGYLEAPDRYGTVRRFPLLSLSLAALTVSRPQRASLFALSAAAADAKRKVKDLSGSNVLVLPAPGEGPADPAADLGRVRAEIERNPALAREVRRLAAARRPAGAVFAGSSLDEALLVLGYKEVRRLISERKRRTP